MVENCHNAANSWVKIAHCAAQSFETSVLQKAHGTWDVKKLPLVLVTGQYRLPSRPLEKVPFSALPEQLHHIVSHGCEINENNGNTRFMG